MKKKPIIAALILILLGIALYYGYQYFQRHRAPLTLYGNVDTRSVNIGFRVAGRLNSLAVDEGDNVTEGQVLGKLDPGPYLDALEQAEANVASAKARLSLLEAGYRDEEIAQARADVAQRQAAWLYADSLFQRQQVLWGKRLISQTTLDDARTTRDQAQAVLQSAKDRLRLYQNGNRPQQVEEARANLLQYKAAKSQALRNVLDTTLLAPSSGVVLTRAVEPGTILSASNSVFTLSLTEPVWIRAYVNEASLGKVSPGTAVEIVTDSHPDHVYHGKVGFVSPTAEFTPKNVETPDLRTDLVYRLRVVVSDADEALRQGMPVTLSVADGAQ